MLQQISYQEKTSQFINGLVVVQSLNFAFGTINAKTLTLKETFQYPITSVPLSKATLDGELQQFEKASLINFLFSNSNATTNFIPRKNISVYKRFSCCAVTEF